MLKALLSSTAHAALADPLKAEYRAPTEAEVAANPALKEQMILDVGPEGGYALDNVEALKKTVGTEKGRADKAEATLKQFEGLPKDAKAKLEKLTELEKLDPEKDAERIAEAKFEGMKKDLIAQHEEEVKPLKEREKVLFTELDKEKRISTATKAIVDAGGNVDVLLPHVLAHTKFEEKDGKFVVSVIDPTTGSPRIGDAHGNGMSLEQLVADFKGKDSFAPLFEASGRSGGGAQPGTGQGQGRPPAGQYKSAMSLNDRADFIEQHGQDAYLALPNAPPGQAASA